MQSRNLLALFSFTLGLLYSATIQAKQANNMYNSQQLYQAFNGDVSRLMEHLRQHNQVLTVAHRGGIAPGYPENSMPAIMRVINNAPVILEVDVMASVDGVDLLHHDKTLERTTTGAGRLDALTWSDIQSFKIKDQSNQVLDLHILRFDEFLASIAQKTFLMLDMKSPSSEVSIVKHIKRYNMLGATIFIAYDLEQAVRIHQADRNAILALGAANMEKLLSTNSPLTASPLVALLGDVQQPAFHFLKPAFDGHYRLAGGYLGTDPLDAQIELGSESAILQGIKSKGLQLLVSNQPLAMHKALSRADLQIKL